MNFIVKGARNPKHRWAGFFTATLLLEADFQPSRQGGLHQFRQLEFLKHLPAESLRAQLQVQVFLELIYRSLAEEDAHPEIFAWLIQVLEDTTHASGKGLTPDFFFSQLLEFWSMLGFAPLISENGQTPPSSFNLDSGRFLSSAREPGRKMPLNLQVQHWLMAQKTNQVSEPLPLSNSDAGQLSEIFLRLFQLNTQAHKPLQSLRNLTWNN